MKRVFKFFGVCLVVVYLFIAVGLTICLLNYNDYKITVINDNSLLIVEDDSLKPNYNKGDLLVIKKNANDDIHVNDKIFFYNQYEGMVVVNESVVTKTQKISDTETTFTVDNKYDVSSEYVIGKEDTTKVYNNFGKVLGLLESKWGFLLIIILPISLLFIYEIYAVIMEIKNPKRKVAPKVKVNDTPRDNNVLNDVKDEVKEEKEVTDKVDLDVKEEVKPVSSDLSEKAKEDGSTLLNQEDNSQKEEFDKE